MNNVFLPHSQEINELIKVLNSTEKGLDDLEAKKRLEKYGFNEIKDKSAKSPLSILISQFKSIFVYILFTAAVISYLTEHAADAIVILIVILINALIGFAQEYKAENAVKALKSLIVPTAKVLRNNVLMQIDAKHLVPGDIIIIEEGDKIPADARIITATNFRTIESSLTGESSSVDKDIDALKSDTPIGDRKNMVWMSTLCVAGKGTAIVTSTGEQTAIGQIAYEIKNVKEEKSHFEQITDALAKQMGIIALFGSLIIFIVGYFINQIEFREIFLFSIASLVSAIPEGLPAMLTIVLALGASKMAQKKAVVRDLKAAETLGVVNVIATDKTGTLTQNVMNVEIIQLANGESFNITGEGWNTKGNFLQNNTNINIKDFNSLVKLLKISYLSNSSQIQYSEDKRNIIGDPTEAALKVLASKSKIIEDLNEEIVFDMNFSTDKKYRATIIKSNTSLELFVVGAPEILLKRSTNYLSNIEEQLDIQKQRELEDDIKKLSKQSYRVIGLAYKSISSSLNTIEDEVVKGLTFVGFVGMKDPARPEAKEAVLKAKRAGIRVIMLTGDHKDTAFAIAKEVGIADNNDQALTEEDLLNMSEEEFSLATKSVNVFARLTPYTKLRIAKELQQNGSVIAMTGDGVNDAPALKQADIGISMGIIGTDTAREASEIILTDDNFATIVKAIEEGRRVFNNVRRSSTFLVTTNVAEQITILLTILLKLPLPLIPAQILWLNLVTDGVSNIALATEQEHGTELKRAPRKRNEGILTKQTVLFVLAMSVVMMVLTFIFYTRYLPQGIEAARTVAFLCMSFTQLFNSFNLRSFSKSVFSLGIFSNKFLLYGFLLSVLLNIIAIYTPFFRNLLSFDYIEPVTVFTILILSSCVLWLGEVYKIILNKLRN